MLHRIQALCDGRSLLSGSFAVFKLSGGDVLGRHVRRRASVFSSLAAPPAFNPNDVDIFYDASVGNPESIISVVQEFLHNTQMPFTSSNKQSSCTRLKLVRVMLRVRNAECSVSIYM